MPFNSKHIMTTLAMTSTRLHLLRLHHKNNKHVQNIMQNTSYYYIVACNKQTTKQASKQAHKQTRKNKQEKTNKQANKPTKPNQTKQASKQTNQASKQTNTVRQREEKKRWPKRLAPDCWPTLPHGSDSQPSAESAEVGVFFWMLLGGDVSTKKCYKNMFLPKVLLTTGLEGFKQLAFFSSFVWPSSGFRVPVVLLCFPLVSHWKLCFHLESPSAFPNVLSLVGKSPKKNSVCSW